MFKWLILLLYLNTSKAQVSGDFGGAGGGAVRIGGAATACSTTIQGAIRYDSSDGSLYFCDGYNWKLATTDPCANSLPNNWDFTDLTGQNTSSVIVSSIHQVTNIAGCSVPIKMTGTSGSPQYRICDDSSCSTVSQDWSSSQRTIINNQYVQLRLTTGQVGSTTSTVALTVGDRVESWNVTTTSDCAAAEPTPGSMCSDGTIYIGRSPDGGTKMYTTACNGGAIYNGTSCTGNGVSLSWAKGTTINTGNTGYINGESQTANLAGLSNADSPYSAAIFCNSLVLHGQSDWYLPSRSEATYLQSLCGLIPDAGCNATRFWTSTESTAANAFYFSFSGTMTTQSKLINVGSGTYIRCIRKD